MVFFDEIMYTKSKAKKLGSVPGRVKGEWTTMNLIGMRTIKTGIAVTLSIYLSMVGFVTNPFYAAIAAILAMQNTVTGSFSAGKNRIFGTLLGGGVGFCFALGAEMVPSLLLPLYIGLAIVTALALCQQFKLTAAIPITLTVCFSIIIGDAQRQLYSYALIRSWDTIVGILTSLLINVLIAQPNYLENLAQEIQDTQKVTMGFIKDLLVNKEVKLDELRAEIIKLDSVFRNYKADNKLTNNPVSLQKLQKAVDTCHDIYFHARSLVKLDGEGEEMAELSPANLQALRDFFQDNCQVGAAIVEGEHPVLEYHVQHLVHELCELSRTTQELSAILAFSQLKNPQN